MLSVLLAWMVGSDAPATGVSDALVGYGVAAPLVAWLIWQLRTDRTAYRADAQAHRDQLDLEREANRVLYERVIEQQAQLGPVLSRCLQVLEAAAEAER